MKNNDNEEDRVDGEVKSKRLTFASHIGYPSTENSEYPSRLLLRLSYLFFAASLCLPAVTVYRCFAVYCDPPRDTYWGVVVLLLGWLALAANGVGIAWFANIGYILSIIFIRRGLNQYSRLFSLFAIVVSYISWGDYRVYSDWEGGYSWYISKLEPGFYFWISSLHLMFLASLSRQNK